MNSHNASCCSIADISWPNRLGKGPSLGRHFHGNLCGITCTAKIGIILSCHMNTYQARYKIIAITFTFDLFHFIFSFQMEEIDKWYITKRPEDGRYDVTMNYTITFIRNKWAKNHHSWNTPCTVQTTKYASLFTDIEAKLSVLAFHTALLIKLTPWPRFWPMIVEQISLYLGISPFCASFWIWREIWLAILDASSLL